MFGLGNVVKIRRMLNVHDWDQLFLLSWWNGVLMLVEDLIFLDLHIADVDSTSFSRCYFRFCLSSWLGSSIQCSAGTLEASALL